MTILHIPSWYPNDNNSFHGSFIKRQIEAISDLDSKQHIVLIWHNTKTFSLKTPFSFLKGLLMSYKKPKQKTSGNIIYVEYNYFLSYYPFFGDNEKKLINKTVRVASSIHKKYNIDLIHSHVTYPGGYIGQRIGKRINRPYIISEHMGPFPFENFKTDLQNKIIVPIQKAGKVIAVSNFQAKEIESYCGIIPEVIPNVIDEREFSPVKKNETIDVFCFLCVGHLSPVKGIDILIHSLHLLKQNGITNFKIKIGGTGPILLFLQNLAKELNVENLIEWLGELDRQQIIYNCQKCNCFISPSRHESFGVAIVEALACGKPAIATKCGGPEDTIHDLNGLLVEKENPKELANAMEWMLKNYQKFDPLQIRKDYEEKYSRKVIATKYMNIYAEILK